VTLMFCPLAGLLRYQAASNNARAAFLRARPAHRAIFPNRELHGALGNLLHRVEHVAASRDQTRAIRPGIPNDCLKDHSGSKPAVIRALALGLLYLSNRN
jgi:hypothetical protein